MTTPNTDHVPPTAAELDEWRSLCETFLGELDGTDPPHRAKDALFQIRVVDEVFRLRALEAVSQAENFHSEGLLAVGNELLARRADSERIERMANALYLAPLVLSCREWEEGYEVIIEGHGSSDPRLDAAEALRAAADLLPPLAQIAEPRQ